MPRFTYDFENTNYARFPHAFSLVGEIENLRIKDAVHFVTEAEKWCAQAFGEKSYWRSSMFVLRLHTDDQAFAFRLRWC
jgi:hypothetical protein